MPRSPAGLPSRGSLGFPCQGLARACHRLPGNPANSWRRALLGIHPKAVRPSKSQPFNLCLLGGRALCGQPEKQAATAAGLSLRSSAKVLAMALPVLPSDDRLSIFGSAFHKSQQTLSNVTPCLAGKQQFVEWFATRVLSVRSRCAAETPLGEADVAQPEDALKKQRLARNNSNERGRVWGDVQHEGPLWCFTACEAPQS